MLYNIVGYKRYGEKGKACGADGQITSFYSSSLCSRSCCWRKKSLSSFAASCSLEDKREEKEDEKRECVHITNLLELTTHQSVFSVVFSGEREKDGM